MSQGQRGIKALALSLLAALGLMAFTAAAAQAGEFKLEGSTFTSKGVASETVTGTIAEGEFLLPGISVTLRCAGGTFSGTILLGGVAHASALFSGCEVLGSKICKPFETKAKMEENKEADKGFIAAAGLGELVLMGGKHYLLVSATASAPFTTIYMPKLCASPLENVVLGTFVLSLPEALTSSVSQTVNTIPQAELESLWPADKFFCGTSGAWFDGGSASVTLSGANIGKKWGGE